MGEKAFRWILRIVGIVLLVVPVLTALAIYGASLNLVMPQPNPLESLAGIDQTFGEDSIELIDNRIVGTNFELTIRLTSPIGYVLEFNEFSAQITCDLETPHTPLGTVSLKEPVAIQPNSSAELTLTASWIQVAAHYLSDHPAATEVRVNLENLTFKLYGITIQTDTGWEGLTFPLV